MDDFISCLDKARQLPYALGNAMKNPALATATLDGVPYKRGQHREYWAALRRRKAGSKLTIHMQF